MYSKIINAEYIIRKVFIVQIFSVLKIIFMHQRESLLGVERKEFSRGKLLYSTYPHRKHCKNLIYDFAR